MVVRLIFVTVEIKRKEYREVSPSNRHTRLALAISLKEKNPGRENESVTGIRNRRGGNSFGTTMASFADVAGVPRTLRRDGLHDERNDANGARLLAVPPSVGDS